MTKKHAIFIMLSLKMLPVILRKITNSCPAGPRFIRSFENIVDPDQLASDKSLRSRSTLLSTLIENTYNWNAAG